MKILRIKLTNLNSLRGAHEVDFQAAPLAGAGLFAITGPTGAGKSTLLDAITLALYGRAARYGSTPSPEDMMSRHCGDCSAEVEFRIPSGTYRAEWQLRRAHGKAGGKVQGAKRYVYDAQGNTLAQNVQETERLIEELIGLDYGRFLRSALLAQGDFAQFLKARPDDRAALLESLTGTAIYSELGTLAHTEAGRRENELRTREASLQNIPLLPEEERARLAAAIPPAEAAIAQVKLDLQETSERLHQAANLAAALEQERKAVSQQQMLAVERAAAAPDLQRLAQHRLTLPFQDDLAKVEAASAVVSSARQLLDQARREELGARHNARLGQAGFLHKLTEETANTQKARALASAKIQQATERKALAEAWLQAHAADASLPAGLPDLVALLVGLKGSHRDLAREWTQLRSLVAGLGEEDGGGWPMVAPELGLSESQELLETRLARARDKVQKAITARQAAEAEWRLREDHLKQTRLVASLEEQRADLRPGEACPLCGALEHPYTKGVTLTFPFESLEARVTEAKAKHRQCDIAVTERTQLQREVEAAAKRFLQVLNDHRQAEQAATGKLAEFALARPPAGTEDALKTSLQQRATEYTRQANAASQAERDQVAAQAELERHLALLTTLMEKVTALEAATEAEAGEPTETEPLPPPPRWPNLAAAENEWNTTRGRLTTARANLGHRQADAEREVRVYAEHTARLAEALVGSTFASLESIKSARLTRSEAQRLEAREAGLQERQQQTAAELKAAQTAISEWRQKAAPEAAAVEELKSRQAALQSRHDQTIRDLSTWRNQLQQDEANRRKVAEKQKELESERQRLVVWTQLRGLIGSHDGRTFRRYAQSVSLDVLIHYANRQLRRLNDRYQLRRRPGDELELEIADLHQAGAVRPMASLSGGESFLASLALALGLSDIAGRKVRIESLFIDEGFGTLDSDTLDVAISALETLRQDNKTVGVISHVDLLKERIATQIIVEKQSGGTSTVRVVS